MPRATRKPRPRRRAVRRPRPRRATVDYETFLAIALALPAAEEGTHHGTPAVRIAGRFLARLREEGVIAIRCGFEDRERLMEAWPKAFYLTDHYANHPAVLIRLGEVRVDVLREVVEAAWRRVAPKRLVADREAGGR